MAERRCRYCREKTGGPDVCGRPWCVEADQAARSIPKSERIDQSSVDPEQATQERLLRGGFPAALVHHKLADFDVDTPAEPCNVLLSGPNGTGKTALACAIVRAWDCRAEFISAYRLLSRIKSTFRRNAEESEADVLDMLESLPVLVLDDLGAQHNTEFGLATIYEVVKERCESYKPTIVTTNLTFTEIDKVEPRLASRLAAFKRLKLEGADRRVKGDL